MLSDKMTLSALFSKQLDCLGLTAGSPRTPLCLDWIILASGLKLTAKAGQPRRRLCWVSEAYSSSLPGRLRACAASNIETSRQKTFVRLNKVVRGKEFVMEKNGECVWLCYKILFNSPTPAAVVVVVVAADVVEVVRRMTQRCCENRPGWVLTWFLAGQSNPPFLLSFGLVHL